MVGAYFIGPPDVKGALSPWAQHLVTRWLAAAPVRAVPRQASSSTTTGDFGGPFRWFPASEVP